MIGLRNFSRGLRNELWPNRSEAFAFVGIGILVGMSCLATVVMGIFIPVFIFTGAPFLAILPALVSVVSGALALYAGVLVVSGIREAVIKVIRETNSPEAGALLGGDASHAGNSSPRITRALDNDQNSPLTLEAQFEAAKSVATKDELKEAKGYEDVICRAIMEDPVKLNTGDYYVDRTTVHQLLRESLPTCPFTRDSLQSYEEAPGLKQKIINFVRRIVERKATRDKLAQDTPEQRSERSFQAYIQRSQENSARQQAENPRSEAVEPSGTDARIVRVCK